jgi:nucleotide-binding universal stress UspA family protein
MSIKTILLHLADDPRNAARTAAAIAFAARHDAHLVGLYTVSPLIVPGYIGAELPAQVYADFEADAESKASEAEQAFNESVRKEGVSSEWRKGRGFARDIISTHAYYADIAVVGQPASGEEVPKGAEGLPGDLALASGRPILAIPSVGDYPSIGKKILLAWNGSREAARATADAMPLLTSADEILVVAANLRSTTPAMDIATHLARHGIKVQTKNVQVDDISIGDILINTAGENGSDLIVMGAYGHTRLNELVFGGATRYLLKHMTVPVMMSH